MSLSACPVSVYTEAIKCAQASETSVSDHRRSSQNETPQVWKITAFSKPVASFTALSEWQFCPLQNGQTSIVCLHLVQVSTTQQHGFYVESKLPLHETLSFHQAMQIS